MTAIAASRPTCQEDACWIGWIIGADSRAGRLRFRLCDGLGGQAVRCVSSSARQQYRCRRRSRGHEPVVFVVVPRSRLVTIRLCKAHTSVAIGLVGSGTAVRRTDTSWRNPARQLESQPGLGIAKVRAESALDALDASRDGVAVEAQPMCCRED